MYFQRQNTTQHTETKAGAPALSRQAPGSATAPALPGAGKPNKEIQQ
jgi:hypothetical protein